MTSKRSQLLHDVFVGSFVLPKECPRVVPIDDGQLTPDKAIVATVGRRIVASLLDSAVFCAIMQMVQAPILLGLSRFLVNADLDNPAIIVTALYVLVPGFAALVAVLLFAAFEASALQATPGKIVAGLKVTGQTGLAITFSQAIAKQFNQGLAYLSLYPIFGFVWLVKLALPGAESALSLIGFFVFYLVYASILCITFKSGQTLLDRICERYVLLDAAKFSPSREEPSDTVRLTESWRLEN